MFVCFTLKRLRSFCNRPFVVSENLQKCTSPSESHVRTYRRRSLRITDVHVSLKFVQLKQKFQSFNYCEIEFR